MIDTNMLILILKFQDSLHAHVAVLSKKRICKMLEKTHDKYKLNSKCRILKAAFGHSDLIDMRNMP